MKLSIIIINYKTPDLTHRCIQSIYDARMNCLFEIIVVDNDSRDNSQNLIVSSFPEVVWISNPENAGFGRGNNLGARQAKGEFILFLNSDMLLLQNFDFADCLKQFDQNQNLGVLGCKLLNEDGSHQKSSYYDVGTFKYLLSYNIAWYKIFKPTPKSLDAVMGSFMLLKKSDFEQIDGFDADFFMYAEELELCKRMQKIGKEIYYFSDYTAIHKHGGSSDGSTWSLRQNMLSNALLYLKLKGFFGYVFYHFLFHVNMVTNSILGFRISKNERKTNNTLYIAYLSYYLSYFWIPFYYGLRNKKTRKFLKAKR